MERIALKIKIKNRTDLRIIRTAVPVIDPMFEFEKTLSITPNFVLLVILICYHLNKRFEV